MEWNENHTQLNYLLADFYDDKDESKAVAKKGGLNTGLIAFKDQPYNNWFNIIDAANKQGKTIALLSAIMQPQERGGSADPGIQQTLLSLIDNLKSDKAPVRNALSIEKKAEDTPGNLEKIMGAKSTLLPISFLEQGMQCAKAVVRIDVGNALGSGFLIAGNWVITNNHVLPDIAAAASAKIQFNYQKNLAGLDMAFEEFTIAKGDGNFFTSKDDDWSFVKLNGDANAKYGALNLAGTAAAKDDFVNIIQHPAGGPKQIALYHNVVTSVDDKYVFYLTDTLPGSSGSPAFNSEWEVVALHHWGGTTKEAYSNMSVYRNRGVNIIRIKSKLKELNITV